MADSQEKQKTRIYAHYEDGCLVLRGNMTIDQIRPLIRDPVPYTINPGKHGLITYNPSPRERAKIVADRLSSRALDLGLNVEIDVSKLANGNQ